MKLLVVCSSLDLVTPFSATPAWWQLLKGMHEAGAHLLVTAYHGRVPETPWWHAYPNPVRMEGHAFAVVRSAIRALRPARPAQTVADSAAESRADRMVRQVVRRVALPRWRRHLRRILRQERSVDAVLLVSVPPNHLRGLARDLRREFARPVFFYDGDVPASLPEFRGFASGFQIYPGADLREFDGVLSNSLGGLDALRHLGAQRVRELYYAADPGVYAPAEVAPDIDVFYYGHTKEYRADWLEAMVTTPSLAMPDARFAVRGVGLHGLGRVTGLPYGPFNGLRDYISRSRINLIVPRGPHARVYASSTMRPFELAMMGACIVSAPYLGIEEWFTPGKEMVVVGSPDEAAACYRSLLRDEAGRRAMGAAARKRALAEHTYRQRAAELLGILREWS
jgi:glycosyl transferase family 1